MKTSRDHQVWEVARQRCRCPLGHPRLGSEEEDGDGRPFEVGEEGAFEVLDGELAIGRAAVILKSDKMMIDLIPIRHDPDAAGLIGAAHLAPRWMFEAHDAILAVDIGGTNIRAGVVELNLKKAAELSKD